MKGRGAFAAALVLMLALAATAPAQVPQPVPVTPDARTVAASTYVVKRGDTLLAIAARTGAGADVIAHANGLPPSNIVRIGQKLKIPAGRYHLVRGGQGGMAIARAYGVAWPDVAALNHLEPPFTLRPGQRLLLPEGAPAASVAPAGTTLEQRAAAFRIDLGDAARASAPAPAEAASPSSAAAAPAPPADPAVRGKFHWPLAGRITRPFGPMANGGRSDGIIIAVKRGTPILAAADGVVAWAGTYPAFGNVLLVRHTGGWVTIYGNAEALLVKRGQNVKRGQTIARAGDTGSAREPQLYFQMLEGRKPVDPLRILPPRR